MAGFTCNWECCPFELQDEAEWLVHIAMHVFGDETTPGLGSDIDGMSFAELCATRYYC